MANGGMTEFLIEFVMATIKKMVDKEDEVFVDAKLSTKNILIQIKSSKSDVGKIIGKKGRSIEALKIITSAIKNTKFPTDSRNICLEILEDDDSKSNYDNK